VPYLDHFSRHDVPLLSMAAAVAAVVAAGHSGAHTHNEDDTSDGSDGGQGGDGQTGNGVCLLRGSLWADGAGEGNEATAAV
jgi:hypothetical protein